MILLCHKIHYLSGQNTLLPLPLFYCFTKCSPYNEALCVWWRGGGELHVVLLLLNKLVNYINITNMIINM